jgi:DNA replicative helicase MCM subunit Mcm2 (Cdc46/Mcm family)
MEMKVDRSKLFDRLIHFCCLDIKKSVACLLMGGSKKMLPDGMRLRGDINVLLLGDPGTAKSQLLKFVEKVAPISVYTSGKGSSAAGLTAVVQRDPVSVRTLPISSVDADLCFL